MGEKTAYRADTKDMEMHNTKLDKASKSTKVESYVLFIRVTCSH